MDPELPPPQPIHEVQVALKEWILKNAQPKCYPKPPKINRGVKRAVSSEFIDKLATPRHKYVKPSHDPTSWVYKLKHRVKKEALEFVITPRLDELAVPKHMYIKPEDDACCWAYLLTHRVTPWALSCTASEKTIRLANPKIRRRKWRKRRRAASSVSKAALKAIASKRVIALFRKPHRQNPPEKEYAYGVIPAALKAVASKRIKKLAQPKQLIMKLKSSH